MGQHRQRVQRRVEGVERLGIAADTQDFHIGHEHEEGAGQDKTDHDGAGYRLQRILCFIAECAVTPSKPTRLQHPDDSALQADTQ